MITIQQVGGVLVSAAAVFACYRVVNNNKRAIVDSSILKTTSAHVQTRHSVVTPPVMEMREKELVEKAAEDKGNFKGHGDYACPVDFTSGVYYSEYLQLDKLLNIQQLRTQMVGETHHDEMIFMIVHQVYELWMKQIIYEIDSIISLLSSPGPTETEIGIITQRLNRTVEICKVMVSMISILETIAPASFNSFRSALKPASGFQSVQFRIIESKLGIAPQARLPYQQTSYTCFFKEQDRPQLHKAEIEKTLFAAVDGWLARITPLEASGRVWNFWENFERASRAYHDDSRQEIMGTSLPADYKQAQLKALQRAEEETEMALGSAEKEGGLSATSRRNAILIIHYPQQFWKESRVIDLLLDIDEQLQAWRGRHMALAHRMIGNRFGSTDHTATTSGHLYLRATMSDRYSAFAPLARLATYLIPPPFRPSLPTTGIRLSCVN